MFSTHNPNLQLIWDATSLTSLQKCPRFYQYRIIQGWREPENEHLSFGGMFQEAVEAFQKARLGGASVPEATLVAMRRALQVSGYYAEVEHSRIWDTEEAGPVSSYDYTYTWHPWGGVYADRWRCTGTEPYKNARGNKAKCPYSHVGKWFEDMPGSRDVCDSCGATTEHANHYLPDHPTKNREGLIRMVAWFCDSQDETAGLQPFAFTDGTPAIELQVVVPLGRKAPGGEDYILVANIDELNTWRGRIYVTDNKTTAGKLNERYFRQFAPHTQFDFYDLVTSIAFQELDIGGLAVRGIQVTKEGGDIKTRWINKSEGQRAEAFDELHWWLDLAEKMAADGVYPMNRSDCQSCPFAPICDMDPADRPAQLAADFEQRHWHPIYRGGVVPQEEEDE